jgi:hypothetical protein
MIYQHRLVVARGGKLEKRHEQFQRVSLNALDEHGSQLVGAWEIWVGPDAGCALWQLREHESLATWEQHRERAMADSGLTAGQTAQLYPNLDFCDTSILKLVGGSPSFPDAWPAFNDVRGQPRGFIEQRILYFTPNQSAPHHAFYFDQLCPALEREGASLIGLFDTVIGPGTTNVGSHRSVEIRRFPDMASWQRWREIQDEDTALSTLIKSEWLSKFERIDSTLMRPMDYSLIR